MEIELIPYPVVFVIITVALFFAPVPAWLSVTVWAIIAFPGFVQWYGDRDHKRRMQRIRAEGEAKRTRFHEEVAALHAAKKS